MCDIRWMLVTLSFYLLSTRNYHFQWWWLGDSHTSAWCNSSNSSSLEELCITILSLPNPKTQQNEFEWIWNICKFEKLSAVWCLFYLVTYGFEIGETKCCNGNRKKKVKKVESRIWEMIWVLWEWKRERDSVRRVVAPISAVVSLRRTPIMLVLLCLAYHVV